MHFLNASLNKMEQHFTFSKYGEITYITYIKSNAEYDIRLHLNGLIFDKLCI